MTSPERHRRSEEIFTRALELEAGSRESFLDEECADDVALRADVRSLLEAFAEAEGFMRRPVMSGLLGVAQNHQMNDPAIGRSVGPYRLIQCLGVGGMGRVYLAERQGADFTQRVAVKLITHGVYDRDALRRFGNECRALATLEHPHVTRMIDGALTEDGTPYIVMEFVDGDPIDVHCELRELGTRARLELFLDLCTAVAHVHKHSILHRDIKPSNVLVDREGRVKLVDFGIARVLDVVEPGEDAATKTVLQVMTPQYASPEQLRGESLTTASDQYALGVLLYRILTGCLPFAESSTSAREQERLVSSVSPTRPSERVFSERPDLSSLARSLAGDLDAIMLMALRTEPERRYASVVHFADDIRRHLRSEPVLARPDRMTYRVRKFAQRHRVPVTLGSLTAIALIGAMISGFLLYARAERSRHIAEVARVEAEANARTAEEITNFLSRLFEKSDPNVVGSQELTASQMLELGTRRLHEELQDQPRVRVRLLRTLSEVHRRRGALDQARVLAEEAVRIARTQQQDDSELAQTLVVYGIYLERLQRYDEALSAFAEAESLALYVGGPDHPQLPRITNCLGIAHLGKGDLKLAVPYMRKSLMAREREIGSDNPELAYYQLNLAETLRELGEYGEAAPLYARALALREQQLAHDHPQLIFAQLAYGAFLNSTSEHERARMLLESALDQQIETYGIESEVSASLSWELGRSYEALDEVGRAEEAFERAVSIFQGRFGEDTPWAAGAHCGLGRLGLRAGDIDGARARFEMARKCLEDAHGVDHYQIAEPMHGLAMVALAEGEWEVAIANSERALQLLETTLGAEHPRLIEILDSLIRAHESVGQIEQAQYASQRRAALLPRFVGAYSQR